MKKFMFSLALCHTVITEVKDEEITYNASSPDEMALINLAKFLGVEYRGKDENNNLIVYFSLEEKEYKYKLLHVLEFTSLRFLY